MNPDTIAAVGTPDLRDGPIKIALLQMTSGIDAERNAQTMVDAVGEAAARGAKMLFTPEMSNIVDGDAKRIFGAVRVESEDGALARMREAAAHHRIWVHIGSLAILGDDGKLANRGFVISDSGAIVARYDKMHLFDVDLPTGESWRESSVYTRGERAVVAQTPLGGIGMAICYDLRFADLFRALSDAGATILTIPAAFTRPTGAAHWHVMQRARAIEAAAFVISAAQTGEHEDGRATYGHSLVIDPWGEIILDMGETVGLGFAEIDYSRLAAVRERVPVLKHRRVIPAPEILRPL